MKGPLFVGPCNVMRIVYWAVVSRVMTPLNQVIAIIPSLRVVLNRRSVASTSGPMVRGPGAFDVS